MRCPEIIAAALIVLFAAANPALADARSAVRAELLSEREAKPGAPFTAAVRLTMEKGWHTYWANPGDGGLATKIEWKMPEGFMAGPVQWPAPRRFGDKDVMNYGYDGSVVLLMEITPPASAAGAGSIAAKVSWLACNQICVPGSAEVRMELGAPDIFEAARKAMPVKPDGWSFAAVKTEGTIRFSIEPPPGEAAPSEAYFFPSEELVLSYAAPQKLESGAAASLLTLKISGAAEKPPRLLKGVLVIRQSQTDWAFEVETPIKK